MNLGQVVDYDTERKVFRIAPELAYQPNTGGPVHAPTVRYHQARRLEIVQPMTCRKALRRGGQEVIYFLRSQHPRRVTYQQLLAALPHVQKKTLDVRLINMAARGDISRKPFSALAQRGAVTGKFQDFLYGLGTSTAATT